MSTAEIPERKRISSGRTLPRLLFAAPELACRATAPRFVFSRRALCRWDHLLVIGDESPSTVRGQRDIYWATYSERRRATMFIAWCSYSHKSIGRHNTMGIHKFLYATVALLLSFSALAAGTPRGQDKEPGPTPTSTGGGWIAGARREGA